MSQRYGHIVVTGNTGIDALLTTRKQLPDRPVFHDTPDLVYLTARRRENIGAGITNICDAALRLIDRGDIRLLCPVHPNPALGATVRARLGRHPAITLTGALGDRETIATMVSATLILTDSGGIPPARRSARICPMVRPSFPFGRGDAAEKILDALEQYFSSGPCRDHPLPFAPSWIMDGGPEGA